MKESDLKRTCEGFLGALQNMGRLMYLRLNSGSMLVEYKEKANESFYKRGKQRMIRMCPPGTSDNLVILQKPTRNIFVEYKGDGGKQSEVQLRFEKMVMGQGHEYWLVSDFDAFKEAMEEVLCREIR
jgi:hypothetical protein